MILHIPILLPANTRSYWTFFTLYDIVERIKFPVRTGNNSGSYMNNLTGNKYISYQI